MKTKCWMRVGCAVLAAGWAAASWAEVSAAPSTGATTAPETELGKLAASLQPGEMKELKTKGFTRDLINSWYDWDTIENGVRKYGAQHMFNIMTGGWANDAKWDPVSRQMLHFAGGHYASFKFITYSADSNEWTLMPVPPWVDPRVSPKDRPDVKVWTEPDKTDKTLKKRVWPRGHTYDCQAIWPEKRVFALTMWDQLRLYDIDKKEWKPSVPGFRTNSGGPCEGFPELGGLVAFSAPSRICVWSSDTGKKRDLGKIPFGTHGVMEYNPVHKVLVVGGGSGGKEGHRSLSLVDSKGNVRKVKPLPVELLCTPEFKFMCDPVSGEYIVVGREKAQDKTFKAYAFHPILDEWQAIPELHGRFPKGVAVAVNTYGVIAICTGGQVYVYKHKPVWPKEDGDEATPKSQQAVVDGAEQVEGKIKAND